MKLHFKTWRLPNSHTWYLILDITRKKRKTGEKVDVIYTFTTPYESREYWALIPGIDIDVRRGTGGWFEVRLSWLKWSMKLLSREVWPNYPEDETETTG